MAKLLRPHIDFVIYAGSKYKYIGINGDHLIIEDEPGHHDRVLIENCKKIRKKIKTPTKAFGQPKPRRK